MRYFDVYPEYFIELLEALPDNPSVIRGYLMGGFGVLVDSDNPAVWWKALEQDRGEEGAADVVCHLALLMGGKRIKNLIKAAADDEDIHVQADDSQLIRFLFDVEIGSDRDELQSYVVDYYERSGRFTEATDALPPVADPEPPSFETEEPEDDDDWGLDHLKARFSGKARASAQDGAQWTLERDQVPSQRFLSVPEDWQEADLENFLWENWEKVDLGFDDPVYLVERQAQLTADTRDRVDLLARGHSGEYFAIELKIVEASARDWGQLTSYMGELEKSGVTSDKVRGVLVAPSFDKKVLNAVRTEPRVTLLRFSKESN